MLVQLLQWILNIVPVCGFISLQNSYKVSPAYEVPFERVGREGVHEVIPKLNIELIGKLLLKKL